MRLRKLRNAKWVYFSVGHDDLFLSFLFAYPLRFKDSATHKKAYRSCARSVPINLSSRREADGKTESINIQGVSTSRHCYSWDWESSFFPQDLQEFLDGATEGAIIISFGSVVRLDLMPKFQREIIAIFGKMRQRFVWKTANPPKNLPENERAYRWLPQNDVLGEISNKNRN